MYRLTPYLTFRDQAAEAMAFYRSVFGGELVSNTYGDHGLTDDPAQSRRIMHSQLVGPQLTLMAADVMTDDEDPSGKVSISLFGGPDSDFELRRIWRLLAEGGTVSRPLGRAVWGDVFGTLVDRYGVTWLVNIGVEKTTTERN